MYSQEYIICSFVECIYYWYPNNYLIVSQFVLALYCKNLLKNVRTFEHLFIWLFAVNEFPEGSLCECGQAWRIGTFTLTFVNKNWKLLVKQIFVCLFHPFLCYPSRKLFKKLHWVTLEGRREIYRVGICNHCRVYLSEWCSEAIRCNTAKKLKQLK